MRRIKRFILWRMTPLCLLACLCAAPLWLVSAQSGQRPEESLPGVPAGYTIIEGDIQMPIEVVNALRRGEAAPDAGYRITRLWPNGIIPFLFQNTCTATSTCANAPQSGCVSAANQTAMRNAMAVIERVSNVSFRQCANNSCGSGNPPHILIRDSTNDTTVGSGNTCQGASANNSAVGYQGRGQIINITSWGSQFIIVHELLHALGFFHEQSRPDRDAYVDVASLCANVTSGCIGSTYLSNFPIDNGATTYGWYDFDSVMHYGQCSFSRNANCPATNMAFPDGGITIRVKAPYNAELSPDGVQWQAAIGQRRRLSELDRLTVSVLYARPNWRFVDANSTGGNGASNGTFLRPYQSLSTGINATPVGGLLLIQPGTYFAPRTITKNITLRAPLGGVTLRPPLQGLSGDETLASVSAASYNGELAGESIAAAFGENLAAGTASATSLPLPISLGGVTVKVKDSEGTERDAPLFFVSPGQINYLVPAGTSVGVASVAVFKGSARAADGTIPITATAPGLFTADTSGQGVPAAVVLRVRGEAQIIEPLSRYDDGLKRIVPVPIDLGPEGDQVFLILFGTGLRAADSSSAISVTVSGESAEVFFAGATPGFAGLDQANVMLPRSLAGKGEVSVLLTADNRSANAVTVSVR